MSPIENRQKPGLEVKMAAEAAVPLFASSWMALYDLLREELDNRMSDGGDTKQAAVTPDQVN